MKLEIQHRLLVEGEYWDFGRPILDAIQINGKIIVIFDYMSFPRGKQAKNMIAYDLKQNEIWTAQHPTDQQTDTYVHFVSEEPLRACSFASFDCRIDPDTGKLLHAEFTK